MRAKHQSPITSAPPAVVYYLTHGTFPPVGVPGRVALFQIEKDPDGLRLWWHRLRAEILAVDPRAWGRVFDDE